MKKPNTSKEDIERTKASTRSDATGAQASRAQNEEHLRANYETFLSLIENAPFGVYLIDSDFRLTRVSAAAQKVFATVKPLLGRDFAEVLRIIWPEPFATEAINLFKRALTTGEPYRELDTVEKRADIEQVEAYDWVIKRITMPDGRYGVVCYFYDLTERQGIEQRLRASEERLRKLSESFTDYAIFTTDVKASILTWNVGAEKIFGYTAKEIVGKNAEILFTPEDRTANAPQLEMATAEKTGRAVDERWHVRKDYSRFYAHGVTAPLLDNGVLIGYAKIARDLTEMKQAQEELRRQHEELEAIIAGRTQELAEVNETLLEQMEQRRIIEEERIALLQKIVTTQEDERRRIARDMHDSLGQQLTALRLKLASMKSDIYKGIRIDSELENLQELGKRIDSEVNFLVWELRPSALDDLGLVAAIENYVREWSRHYGVNAEFHASRLGRVRQDDTVEINLYRIAQEALNNVQKHAGAKNANVVLEARDGKIVLVIEDDGKGFDPTEIKLGREAEGGLGLVGMRERAAIIGGTVEIESGPGNGTTVFVRVPIKKKSDRSKE